MALFLVERRSGVRAGQREAMVVRAGTAEDARTLAQCAAGKEGREAWDRGKVDVKRLSGSGKDAVVLVSVKPTSPLSRLDVPQTRRGLMARAIAEALRWPA